MPVSAAVSDAVLAAFRAECPLHDKVTQWCAHMGNRGVKTVFEGPETALAYIFNWHDQGNYRHFPFETDRAVVNKSSNLHRKALARLFGGDAKRRYGFEGCGDLVNAQDHYVITHPLFAAADGRPLTVLDFGAGYGRCLNMAAALPGFARYLAVDANEASYLTQYLYLGACAAEMGGLDFGEHFAGGIGDAPIGHLPTWALPQVPDGSVDLVLFNQVLRELGPDSFAFALEQALRCLRPDGSLYVRDHGLRWMPGHRFDDEAALTGLGLCKVFEAPWTDGEAIWGTPRLYRKIDPARMPQRIPQEPLEAFSADAPASAAA